jgi:hypothetical protein
MEDLSSVSTQTLKRENNSLERIFGEDYTVHHWREKVICRGCVAVVSDQGPSAPRFVSAAAAAAVVSSGRRYIFRSRPHRRPSSRVGSFVVDSRLLLGSATVRTFFVWIYTLHFTS